MAEIIKFPENKKEEKLPIESGNAYPMKKERESTVSLDVDKMAFLMGKLSALKKSNPEMFKKLKIDHEMDMVGKYDDYELIMKINNCTENSIRNNPCLYLAINYETWNRNLTDDKKGRESKK